MGKLTPIENVEPGKILDQEILDVDRQNTVYNAGIYLTTEIINNILSLDYLEIEIIDSKVNTDDSGSSDAIPKRVLKPGDYLFLQGEPSTSIYILKRGIVQIIVTADHPPSEDREKAKRYVSENGKIVAQIRKANVKIGEMGALIDGIRTASIKCSTEVEVTEIATSEQAFKHSMMHSPKLALALISMLANRLRKSRKTAEGIEVLHGGFLKKVNLYQAAFEKMRTSLMAKNESQQSVWLTKIINEFKNIPALSDNLRFRKPDLDRKNDILELKEQILPAEMETPVNINTYLALAGRKQENFFILRKGKVVVPDEDTWAKMYSVPGQMLHHLEPLCNPTGEFKGYHLLELKTISPVRLYKIPIRDLEKLCNQHPKLALFLSRSLAKELVAEDHYIVGLLEIFDKDIAVLASGDINYRRGYKKLNRVLEKFTKDAQQTEVERKLAMQMMEQVEKDYASFKDQLVKLHFK
jgi:CRP-like cAMP-binding protein